MLKKLSRLIREPLFQFLLIGTGIYGLYALYGEAPQQEQDRTIVITEDHVNSLATNFASRWNRAPTDEELLNLVKEYLRETLMYREALAMGLDKDDHIIRRRLAQKLEFLTNDLVKLQEPDDAVLEQHLQDNMDRFRGSDRVTFSHVFIDPDKRGDDTHADAQALLEALQTSGQPNEDTRNQGDRFMMQSSFSQADYLEVQRQMGRGFADRVFKLKPGVWHGPVLSGFGVHLIYVSEYVETPVPALAEVRPEVLDDWYRVQTEQFNAQFLDALSERYEIIMDDPVEPAPGPDPEDPPETTEPAS